MNLRHPLAITALGLAGVVLAAVPAGAHVSPSETSAPAGSYLKFELRVPHGCGDTGNTTKVEVQIPDGIFSVTPQVVAGWTITKNLEALEEPVADGHGGEYTERVDTVVWEGGPLANDQLEEFGMSVKLPDTVGETIHFPTVQTCDDGETAEWIQIAAEGEDEPDSPAPAIALTEASGDGHSGGDSHGGDAAEEDLEATPASTTGSASDGHDGTDPLAVAGLVAGLLGLGAGGLALARSRQSA